MLDPTHPLTKLVKKDRRYRIEAYLFVFEALSYAQDVLKLGEEKANEPETEELSAKEKDVEEEEAAGPERHLTGQQLCEAIRLFALEQFGYMAKCVLNSWGIHATGDFGDIVYNLIRIKQMRKSAGDRRADFNDVYDFEKAFRQGFKITMPD